MFEKVRDVIVDTLGCEAEAVTMEATLTEDLGLDSIDAVELNIAYRPGGCPGHRHLRRGPQGDEDCGRHRLLPGAERLIGGAL